MSMVPTTEASDADVIAAVRGDRAAFARLVRLHASAVCAITTAVLADPGAGEEVAQEVFVCAWRDLGQLREPARFAAWLRRIARHRASSALRTRRRRREVLGHALDQLADPSADAGDALDRAEEEALLWTALDGLDGTDREVLVLYYREGRSVREVAEALAMAEPGVRKRLSRARARLRDDVDEALGRQLARTAPGAAFVLGVVAALAPSTARAATRTPWQVSPRRASWIAACGVLLAASVIAASPCPAVSDRPGPRPAETAAGQASLVPRRVPAPILASTSVPVAPEVESVALRLGQWQAESITRSIAMFAPARFWPDVGEAPWPGGRRVARLVRAVVDGETAGDVSDGFADAIAPLSVDADGLPDDPWRALLGLEVARIDARRGYARAWAAFGLAHGLPDPKVDGWKAYNAARKGIDAVEPKADLDPVLELARAVREAWPDHPVADYAALYELAALADITGSAFDRQALGDAAMALVEGSSDPVVIDAAIGQLVNADAEVALTPHDLDLLEAHFDDPDASDAEVRGGAARAETRAPAR